MFCLRTLSRPVHQLERLLLLHRACSRLVIGQPRSRDLEKTTISVLRESPAYLNIELYAISQLDCHGENHSFQVLALRYGAARYHGAARSMSNRKEGRNTRNAILDLQHLARIRTIRAEEHYRRVYVVATMSFNIIEHACHREHIYVVPNVVLLADTTTAFHLLQLLLKLCKLIPVLNQRQKPHLSQPLLSHLLRQLRSAVADIRRIICIVEDHGHPEQTVEMIRTVFWRARSQNSTTHTPCGYL